MNYSRNAVYTRVHDAIKAASPTAYVTSRYVQKPSTFPACLIHEIDRSRPLGNTQLDFEDVQWESVFEIQVVSAKAGTAAKEAYGIMDIGGDDRGAYALGRYVPSILEENNYRMVFVANCYRPLTRTPEEALEVMLMH